MSRPPDKPWNRTTRVDWLATLVGNDDVGQVVIAAASEAEVLRAARLVCPNANHLHVQPVRITYRKPAS